MMGTDTLPATHVVEEVVLDITFGSEKEAFAEQATLPAFIKSEVLSVVETIFQERSDPDEVVTLDRLDVDLGTMPYAGYQEEMLHRLRERLAALLPEHGRANHRFTGMPQRLQTKQESDRRLVEYVLRHGRLPWNARMALEDLMDHLLPEVLADHGEDLMEFLRTCPERDMVVKRLIRQSSEATIHTFLRRLAPDQHREISQWIREIRRVFGVPPFERLSPRRLQEDLWEAVILDRLARGHVSGEWQNALLSIIRRTGYRHGLTDSTMAAWFGRRVMVLEAQEGRPLHLTACLAVLQTLDRAAPPKEPEPLTNPLVSLTAGGGESARPQEYRDTQAAPPDLSAHRETILTSILRGEAETLAAYWDWLSRHHAGFLTDLFREVGRQAAVRRRLAQNLPEAMLVNIADLFVPEWAASMSVAHRLLGLLWPKGLRAPYSPEPIGQVLWMGTLAYLFFTPAHRLDRTAHLKYLISHLAGQDPQWWNPVPGAVDQALREMQVPADLQQDIRRVFETLPMARTGTGGDQAAIDATSKGFIRAYDLYERLRQSFVRTGSSRAESEIQWFSVVEELFEHYPWQLVRLYRDLQAGELVYEQVGIPLSTKQLRRLLHIFLEIAPTTVAGKTYSTPSDVFRAMEAHADQAADVRQYYEQVLRNLAAGRPLDFDQILAAIRGVTPADAGTPPADILRHMIATCLTRTSRPTTEPSAECLQRMESEAGRASDTTEFYAQLLDGLLLNTAIDFEALLKKTFTHDSSLEARPVKDSSHSGRRAPAGESSEWPEEWLSRHGVPEEGQGTLGLETVPSNARTLWERFCQYIQGDLRISSSDAAPLRSCLEDWIMEEPDRVLLYCREALESPHAVARMVHLLSERLLVRVLALALPGNFDRVLRYTDLLVDVFSFLQTEPFLRMRIREVKWQVLLTYFLTEGRDFNEEDFIRYGVESFGRHLGLNETPNWREHICLQLMRHNLPTNEWVHARILKVLSRSDVGDSHPQAGELSPDGMASSSEAVGWSGSSASPGSVSRPGAPASGQAASRPPAGDALPASATSREGRGERHESANPTEAMYVTNAGLVLGAPYFPRLFSMLNLTSESRFVDQEAAERAVHLLQFMVNERTETPEYHLMLNKIFCGIDIAVPLIREIHIHDREKDAIEGLLQSMIQHWARLGNTSITGFRESFLQREGKMQFRENAWHVSVEERAFDMLLDHIPWTFSTIKFPWMEHVLYVEWR